MSSSALNACKEYWPDQFGTLQGTQEEQLRQGLRDARPVLVSAADAMVHVSRQCWLLCMLQRLCCSSSVTGTWLCTSNGSHLGSMPHIGLPCRLACCWRILTTSLGFLRVSCINTVHCCAAAGTLMAHGSHRVQPCPSFRPFADWDTVLPASLEKWGETFDRLTEAVEKRRADLWQQSKVKLLGSQLKSAPPQS